MDWPTFRYWDALRLRHRSRSCSFSRRGTSQERERAISGQASWQRAAEQGRRVAGRELARWRVNRGEPLGRRCPPMARRRTGRDNHRRAASGRFYRSIAKIFVLRGKYENIGVKVSLPFRSSVERPDEPNTSTQIQLLAIVLSRGRKPSPSAGPAITSTPFSLPGFPYHRKNESSSKSGLFFDTTRPRKSTTRASSEISNCLRNSPRMEVFGQVDPVAADDDPRSGDASVDQFLALLLGRGDQKARAGHQRIAEHAMVKPLQREAHERSDGTSPSAQGHTGHLAVCRRNPRLAPANRTVRKFGRRRSHSSTRGKNRRCADSA